LLQIVIHTRLPTHRYTQMLSKLSYRPRSRYPVPWMVICIHPCSLDSGNPCRNDVLLGVCITMRVYSGTMLYGFLVIIVDIFLSLSG